MNKKEQGRERPCTWGEGGKNAPKELAMLHPEQRRSGRATRFLSPNIRRDGSDEKENRTTEGQSIQGDRFQLAQKEESVKVVLL